MGAGEDDIGGRERKAEAAAAVADYSIKLKIFTGTHTSIYAFAAVLKYEED